MDAQSGAKKEKTTDQSERAFTSAGHQRRPVKETVILHVDVAEITTTIKPINVCLVAMSGYDVV